MTLWQISAGEPHRYYEQIFYKYGVMLIGPSYHGCAITNRYPPGLGTDKHNQINHFANSVKVGDRVLIRKTYDLIGIGEIQEGSSYKFVEQFGCVLGWDLCHTWNVSWADDEKIYKKIPNPFVGRKQSPAFTRVLDKKVIDHVESIPSHVFKKKDLILTSDISKPLTDEDIRLKLFQRGVSSLQIESIVLALRQCRQLAAWYTANEHSGGRPTEHEVVSHMLLPLLLALGWSHQQIAVEWNKVDIALFLKTPTNNSNCIGIIEAKGHGQPLAGVLSQAQSYVTKLNLTYARKVIVTDGSNIFIYEREADGGQFNPIPSGYLNIRFLSESYLLPEKASAIETLIQMLPSQF